MNNRSGSIGPRSQSKKHFRTILLPLGSIVLSILLGAEFFTRTRLITPEMRNNGAEYYWRLENNSFLRSNAEKNNACGWEDTLTASPHLGWVNVKLPPCETLPNNNIGMSDTVDFPLSRDPDYFTIALLGGSVADQMVSNSINVNWLQNELNAQYISPNGKPFRVLNGAAGAWSYPNQITFLTLYGSGIDGAIAIDGYNELKPHHVPITRPEADLFLYASRPAAMGWQYKAFLSLRYVRFGVLAVPLLRKSFLIYLPFRRLVNWAKAKLETKKYELVDQYYSFPASWSVEQKDRWNREKYKSYIGELKAVAEASSIQYAHFVQPVPQIGKVLTEEEKSQIPGGWDAELYRSVLAGPSDELRKRGVHTYSLLNVFESERGTIYGDAIHMKIGADKSSRGNLLLARSIGNAIAKDWNLKRKPVSGGANAR